MSDGIPASRRPTPRATEWSRRYRLWLFGADAASALLAWWVGRLINSRGIGTGDSGLGTALLLALPALWVATLATAGAYERRFVGVGTVEFHRVAKAFVRLAAVVAFLLFAARFDPSRRLILTILVLTVGIDLIARVLMRAVLRHWRARGHALSAVLAVGEPDGVLRFAQQLRSTRTSGAQVVGVCTPWPGAADAATTGRLQAAGLPLCGDLSSVANAAAAVGASAVAVLPGSLDADDVRRISWQLEQSDLQLIVSSGLGEMAGHRLHLQPVAGMPLVYVDGPRFRGVQRVAKGLLDRVVAASGLLLTLPVWVGLAALVKFTSPGPVFFRQVRIGKDGRPFRMIKFRSMCVDAELRLDDLVAANDGAGPLFKVHRDPRVTRVGRFLRRSSLDELPQLLNVLAGSMSLVGPRPPLPVEVACYADDVRRRLLVKPGITGVWQVSGRSNLSWDESVRLDLSYVENWSLITDLMVLLKTARAVLRAEGAY